MTTALRDMVAETMIRLAGAPGDVYARRNVAMLRVMFDLALGVGQVAALDLADLEPHRGTVWVNKGREDKELLTLPEPTLAALTAWTAVRGAYAGPLFLALGPRQHRAARLSTKGAARIVQRFRMTVESGGGFG